MKIEPHNVKTRASWLKKPFSDGAYRRWLIDEGSLTARLQSLYTAFHVKAIVQENAKPIVDEATLLKHKPVTVANVREVLLMDGQEALVYAHSVLPHNSLRGEWAKLGKLGNKPLGATLFSDPRVKRTPLSYKKLTKRHALYQKAVAYLPQAPTYLWARRSVFSLKCDKILVTEVFLPRLSGQ